MTQLTPSDWYMCISCSIYEQCVTSQLSHIYHYKSCKVVQKEIGPKNSKQVDRENKRERVHRGAAVSSRRSDLYIGLVARTCQKYNTRYTLRLCEGCEIFDKIKEKYLQATTVRGRQYHTHDAGNLRLLFSENDFLPTANSRIQLGVDYMKS